MPPYRGFRDATAARFRQKFRDDDRSRSCAAVESTSMKKYDFHMSVERITVSLETDLAAAVRDAADADAQNVSSWLADAARRQLAARGLREVVAAWEAEHGAFDDAELAAARARVGA